jgi:thiol-disulfide isomerase/thioredoxin
MMCKFYYIIFTFFILISCANERAKKSEATSTEITGLYIDLEGNKIEIDNYKGKRVLVNFWATWCTPCLKEMPSLVNAQEMLKDKNYVFLFPTTDNIEKVKEFQKNKNYPLQFLHYTSTLDKLEIFALPATFIYDTKGNLAKRIDGATEWDSDEIINLLKSIK